ncbi:CdaR family protein [uncultured Granulicatella sp.]|uniref:CdaR family protein n=1 Tax=uncultured Granulicatella sp. TaxID=316089 RepID=UPI0028D64CD3|nr:CdaR family protein [uncultured Granulicatella sp.]
MISKWMTKKSFLVVISFILTMALFVYASESSPSRQSAAVSIQTTSNTIGNVPVYVDMDSQLYTVTGLPESVTLRIEGSSSSLLAVAGNASYRVKTPNLNELGTGKHMITLQVTGLPSGVKGTVSPETVEIMIEKKATVELPVSVNVNRANLPGAYKSGQALVSPARVTISGPESLINQVENVLATVTVPENTKADYTSSVAVQALDATGKPLALKVEPEQVQVRVPITTNSKKVPLVLTTTGSAGSQYTYQLKSDIKEVTILGAQEILDRLTAIPVVVDVSQMTKTTTQAVKLTLPTGVDSVTPENISVEVVVTPTTTQTTETTQTTQTTRQ